MACKTRSPSSRRAWIEIGLLHEGGLLAYVALLAEGVDRNFNAIFQPPQRPVSPSSRRAWIEIAERERGDLGHDGRPPRGGRG